MFARSTDLKAALADLDPAMFVSRHLLDAIPHVFKRDGGEWMAWRHRFAAKLDVDPRNLLMVGSSAIGWSLNPKRPYNQNRPDSDIDIGVVSDHHFQLAWRELQRIGRKASLSDPERDAVNSHKVNHIFNGTIAADRILGFLSFGKAWQAAIDDAQANEPISGRDIKLRIYRDLDELRSYHERNVAQLQRKIEDAVIPTVDDDSRA